MADDSNNATDKQPRFRSPPYPAVPLAKAIERAASLYAKALHHSVPMSVAASAWDYAPKSSGLFATIAALKQFGLLLDEGSGEKRKIKLTDTAIRLVRDPDPKSEKRLAAIRAAALAPKIHTELWEKYEVAGASGAMDVAVKSYLTLDRADDGAAAYSDDAAEEVIAEYRQTMAFAGLLVSADIPAEEVDSEDTYNLVDEGNPKIDVQHNPRRMPSPAAQLNEELNDIRVEFSSGKVRINALLDIDGLEALEKKIAAFRTILS
jgi:hypothetical protein